MGKGTTLAGSWWGPGLEPFTLCGTRGQIVVVTSLTEARSVALCLRLSAVTCAGVRAHISEAAPVQLPVTNPTETIHGGKGLPRNPGSVFQLVGCADQWGARESFREK